MLNKSTAYHNKNKQNLLSHPSDTVTNAPIEKRVMLD